MEEFREPSHGAIPGPSQPRGAGVTFDSAGYPWDGQDRGVFSRVLLADGDDLEALLAVIVPAVARACPTLSSLVVSTSRMSDEILTNRRARLLLTSRVTVTRGG